MRTSKFTDAQKAFIIKQGEAGIPVADICRKAGIRAPLGHAESKIPRLTGL